MFNVLLDGEIRELDVIFDLEDRHELLVGQDGLLVARHPQVVFDDVRPDALLRSNSKMSNYREKIIFRNVPS